MDFIRGDVLGINEPPKDFNRESDLIRPMNLQDLAAGFGEDGLGRLSLGAVKPVREPL